MRKRQLLAAISALILLSGCATPPVKPVEDLGGGQDVSRFALTSLKGTRDGDRLDVLAIYSEASQTITVSLHFRVTPPTQLISGTWRGLSGEGGVRERSSTFLGGQSGPPSIGGRYDLLAPDGKPLYRVTIPLTELRDKL